jgi:hypothetical protein
MHLIPLTQAHFLLRAQADAVRYAQVLQTLGTDDWLVKFRPSAKTRRQHPDLPPVLVCRLVRGEFPGFRPIWLLTSLRDSTHFRRPDLLNLYHRRWQIETIYREWKHGLDIQNLRSQTPVGIAKEMYAQLLLSNLVRWVMSDAAAGTVHTPVQFSFLGALTAVKLAVMRMLRPNVCLSDLYSDLLAEICRLPIRQRPGRAYPRPGENKVKKRANGTLRLPARLIPLT